MPHVQCPECGGYVSRSVLSCPACGCFLPGHRVLKVLFLASLVVLALALIVFMGFLWLAATD